MATSTEKFLANQRPRVLVNQPIHIVRSLHGPGDILITKGQEVKPQDLIGKSNPVSGYTSIHLAKKLGVAPKDGLKYLQKNISSTIFKGELLAQKKELIGSKKIISPTDGVMEQYNDQTGELRLRFLIKPLSVPVGVFGIVDEIDKQKGEVLIKTIATVIYGPIGFGIQRSGILKTLGNPTSPIQAAQITPDLGQHILVAGALVFKEAIKKATEVGVLGIISGGINTADYRAMVGGDLSNEQHETDVGITILATEGFGPLPLGPDILTILRTYENKFVFLDGNNQRIILPNFDAQVPTSLRKISLPLSSENQNIPETRLEEIEIGQKVRLIFAPFMGMQAVVNAIDKTPTKLDSGISTFLVTVETEHKKIKIPFNNLELIT